MSARTVFAFAIASLAGCASGSASSAEPDASTSASGTTFVPPPPVSASGGVSAAPVETASAAPPAEPAPYPDEAISRARSVNGKLTCSHLIYKRGCAEKRTGHVDVEMTIDADGKVAAVKIVENKINHEPQVIEKCLKESLPKWIFDPPGNAKPTFPMKMIFGDKC